MPVHKLSVFVILMLAFAVLPLRQAHSHSKTETTQPADGSVLASSPSVIAISFDAPMRVTFIRLVDQKGIEHDVDRPGGMAPATAFEAVPAALPSGVYEVEWRGISEDGHSMSGKFSFQIRQ